MARKRKIEVAAINIRIHPHPPGVYERFMTDAFRLRRAVPIRGDKYMILGSLDNGAQDKFQMGTLIKFTQIATDQPWLDLHTFAEAEEDALGNIRIPENLRPNMSTAFFIFFADEHLFLFERYTDGHVFSTSQVVTFLESLSKHPMLLQQYGVVDVSAVADAEGVEEVLRIDRLRSLSMIIRRPNAGDTLAGLTADVQERLHRQRARELKQEYVANAGEALEPDEDTIALANVAAHNGEVVASGRNEQGLTETRSTKDHPAIEAERYDPDVTSGRGAFRTAARRLYERLAARQA